MKPPRFDLSSIDSSKLNTNDWLEVDVQALGEEAGRLYNRRRLAIELLVQDTPRWEIFEKTGIKSTEAIRLLRRCLAYAPDGKVLASAHWCLGSTLYRTSALYRLIRLADSLAPSQIS